MNTRRIVITGGPATGKTSIINELIKRGYPCLEEISRQITLDARENGIDQLFLSNPLKFSELLFKGRKSQFLKAEVFNAPFVFYDRGIPDVLAYMDYANTCYPKTFIETCQNNRYDAVFTLKPWDIIFESDNERYENFKQAKEIHEYLIKSYTKYGYDLINVPFDSVGNRANFILNYLKGI